MKKELYTFEWVRQRFIWIELEFTFKRAVCIRIHVHTKHLGAVILLLEIKIAEPNSDIVLIYHFFALSNTIFDG